MRLSWNQKKVNQGRWVNICPKQDYRRWRYHRRLLDYQSPYFQLKFPLDYQKLVDHRIPLSFILNSLSPYIHLK